MKKKFFAIKTKLKNAEKVKELLIKKNLLLRNIRPEKDSNYIYFPISKKIETKEIFDKSFLKKIALEEFLFEENIKITDYRQLLNLPEEKQKNLPTSYDIIGDIIIIELNGFTNKEEKEIANALLKINKNVKTILKKAGFFSGEFRTRKLKFLSGITKRETIYKENNVKIKLDVEKVYFSPRLSTERKRIAEQIKKPENILVMFSGSGIYAFVIAKNTPAKKIIGIEKNKIAHNYALENNKLNKTNITFINGDVKKIVPKLKEEKEKFDRILMPLPKGAENFLEYAFMISKKGTIIHFYDFENEKEINKAIEKIQNATKDKIKYQIKNIVKCGQYGPEKYRICVDFQITDIL